MALIRTSNPTVNRMERDTAAMSSEQACTYKGIAAKSVYFVLLTFTAAMVAFLGGVPLLINRFDLAVGILIACFIVALISGFVATLAPRTAKIAGTIYAVAEGLTVGFVSLVYYIALSLEGGGGGEVFAALIATIGVAFGMIVLYATGVIRVGSGFKRFMISALVGILIVGLVMFIISIANPALGVIFYGSGPFSIFVSVIMVIFASLMILMDLNRMTEMVEGGIDKKYEWYAAFGLLLTLVWLYLEFLKLFIKLSRYFKK